MNRNDSPESSEPGGVLRVPIHEESIEARVTERQVGSLRITRHVDEVPVEAVVPLRTDDMEVERRAIDETVTETREPWYEGATLVVPVYEEQLVTETRLILKEEVRVRRVSASEAIHIRETVRRERIDVERYPEST